MLYIFPEAECVRVAGAHPLTANSHSKRTRFDFVMGMVEERDKKDVCQIPLAKSRLAARQTPAAAGTRSLWPHSGAERHRLQYSSPTQVRAKPLPWLSFTYEFLRPQVPNGTIIASVPRYWRDSSHLPQLRMPADHARSSIP